MKKEINFYSFYEDYNVSNINCVDLTNATYLGRTNTNMYYYYCFLFCLYNNFNCSNTDSREATLESLGVKINHLKINSYEDLKRSIINGINSDEPILVFFKYRSLFYYKNYRNPEEKKHTVLICNAYDSDKGTVSVLDMLLTRKNLYSIFTGEFYTEIPLTDTILKEMWEYSLKCFTDDVDMSFINFGAYTLKINKKATFDSIEKIIEYFIGVLSNSEDKLILEIKKFNKTISNITNSYTEMLTKNYGTSMYVIVDILRKYFTKRSVKEKDFYNYLHTYYKNRRAIILRISKNIIRKKHLTPEEIELLIEAISNDNKKLLDSIKKLYHDTLNPFEQYKNFTYGAIIKADTELRPVEVLLKDNSMNESHYWVSHKSGSTHWLILDILRPKLIKYIKIKHYGEVGFNTKDFILYASNTNSNWEMLANVSNNKEDINIFEINKRYRFFKLEIITPCERDYYARIKEFNVYGE